MPRGGDDEAARFDVAVLEVSTLLAEAAPEELSLFEVPDILEAIERLVDLLVPSTLEVSTLRVTVDAPVIEESGVLVDMPDGPTLVTVVLLDEPDADAVVAEPLLDVPGTLAPLDDSAVLEETIGDTLFRLEEIELDSAAMLERLRLVVAELLPEPGRLVTAVLDDGSSLLDILDATLLDIPDLLETSDEAALEEPSAVLDTPDTL